MSEDRTTYTAELVFTGDVALVKGGTGGSWLLLGAERELCFKDGPKATVGAVYRWTFADAELTKGYTSAKSQYGPQYVRQLTRADEPRIVQWEANHSVVALKQRLASQAKKEQASDLRVALAPYRNQYRKLIGNEARAAYLMTIMQAVTG